jgi:hypothetical protein
MFRTGFSNVHTGAPRLSSLVAVPLAILLLVSSYAHLDNGFHFLDTVYSYKLAGLWGGILIAVLIPALEFTLGLALLFAPGMRRTAFGWCFLLFASFVGVQSITLVRGLDISCGCFGSASGPIGPASISIAVSGLIGSFVGYLAGGR